MRVIYSEKEKQLWKEVKPFLGDDLLNHPGVVDDAPEEIKLKYEEWLRLSIAEDEAAERINQA
jgi:hypothetical protein